MSRYIQTTLPVSKYKALRIIAIQRDINLTDLVRQILIDWVTKEKELDNGKEENGQDNRGRSSIHYSA